MNNMPQWCFPCAVEVYLLSWAWQAVETFSKRVICVQPFCGLCSEFNSFLQYEKRIAQEICYFMQYNVIIAKNQLFNMGLKYPRIFMRNCAVHNFLQKNLRFIKQNRFNGCL